MLPLLGAKRTAQLEGSSERRKSMVKTFGQSIFFFWTVFAIDLLRFWGLFQLLRSGSETRHHFGFTLDHRFTKLTRVAAYFSLVFSQVRCACHFFLQQKFPESWTFFDENCTDFSLGVEFPQKVQIWPKRWKLPESQIFFDQSCADFSVGLEFPQKVQIWPKKQKLPESQIFFDQSCADFSVG